MIRLVVLFALLATSVAVAGDDTVVLPSSLGLGEVTSPLAWIVIMLMVKGWTPTVRIVHEDDRRTFRELLENTDERKRDDKSDGGTP